MVQKQVQKHKVKDWKDKDRCRSPVVDFEFHLPLVSTEVIYLERTRTGGEAELEVGVEA